MRLLCTFAASGEQFNVEVLGHDTVGKLRKLLASRIGADPKTVVIEACSASLRPELRASGAMVLDEDDLTLVDCLLRDGDFISITVDQTGTFTSSKEEGNHEGSSGKPVEDVANSSVKPHTSAGFGIGDSEVVGSIVEHSNYSDDDLDDDSDEDDDLNAPLKPFGQKSIPQRAFPESPTVFSKEMLVTRDDTNKEQNNHGTDSVASMKPLTASNDISEREMKQIEEENKKRIKAMSESERADAIAEIKSAFSARALEGLEILRKRRQQKEQKEKGSMEQSSAGDTTHNHSHECEDDHEMTSDEWSKIQAENQRIVDSMTDEERQKAVQEIMSTFSPDTLKKLRELRDMNAPKPEHTEESSKTEASEVSSKPQQIEEHKTETKKETPRLEPDKNTASNVSDDFVSQIKWSENEEEAAKQMKQIEDTAANMADNPIKNWFQDAPPTEDPRPVAQIPSEELRFDFEGVVIPPGTDIPVNEGLHHHGGDQWAAGYTLPELCYLSRSTFPSQRSTALTVLGRIMEKAWKGEYGETHKDIGNILCDKFFLPSLLLMAISDTNINIRGAGVTALYFLVVDSEEQEIRSEMTEFVKGDELYSINDGFTFKTQEEEDKEEEEQTHNEDGEEEEEEEDDKKKEPKEDTGFLLDRYLRKKSLLAFASLFRAGDRATPVALKKELAEVLERIVIHSYHSAKRVARDEVLIQALLLVFEEPGSYSLKAAILRILVSICKSTKDAAIAVSGGDNTSKLAALTKQLLLDENESVEPQFFDCQSLLCDLLVICRRAGVFIVDDEILVKICTLLVSRIETIPRRTVFRMISACISFIPQSLVETVVGCALHTLEVSGTSAGSKESLFIFDIQPSLDSLHFLWSVVQATIRGKCNSVGATSLKRIAISCLAFMTSSFFHSLSLSTFSPVEFEYHACSMRPLRCLPGLLDNGVPKGLANGSFGAKLAAASCITYAADVLYECAKRVDEVLAAVNSVVTTEQPGVFVALAASVFPPAPVASLTPIPVMRYLQRPLQLEKLSLIRLLSLTAVPCMSYYNSAMWTIADATGGEEVYVRDIIQDLLFKRENLKLLSEGSDAPSVVSVQSVSKTMLELSDHVLTKSAVQRSVVLTSEFAEDDKEWLSLFNRMDEPSQHFLPLAKDWPMMFLRLGNELAVSKEITQASLQFLSWVCASRNLDYFHSVGSPMWMERLLEISVLPCFLSCKTLVGWIFSNIVNDCNLRDVVMTFERSRSGYDRALTVAQQFVHLFDSESFGDDLMVAIIAFLLIPTVPSKVVPVDFVSSALGTNTDQIDDIRSSIWRTVPHLLMLITESSMRKYNTSFSFKPFWDHPEVSSSLTFAAMRDALKDGRMLKTRTNNVLYWVAVYQISQSLFGDMTTATTFAVTTMLNVMPPRTCCDIVMVPSVIPEPMMSSPSQLACLTEKWSPSEDRLGLLSPAIITRCKSALENTQQ